MKICDLQTGRARIARAAKALREEWLTTIESWTDRNQVDFERQHLEPLAPQITLMSAAVQQLADVLECVEKECSDEEERWEY